MAIISSNIDDSDFSLRKKELRLVDSKIIPEEKRIIILIQLAQLV